ncbi:MAG: hypothetical protein C0467_09665 [Planctomycetaceae bacterium]|nr:hypothetical protein [Planctomycetaceae bacterium]
MILLFPNLDTLRLALTSSIVPADVTLSPAAVTFDDQGKIYLESTTTLTKTITKNLDKIGVKGSKRHGSDEPEDVTCWPQVLPVSRESGTPVVSNQAPVLFELSDADDLPTLVTEMLRLGNDRQGFRWFAAPGDEDTKRVLLRVIGPPYYTLLRAMDKTAAGTKGTVRAYLERAPRVWVELGSTHPLANQIRVADRQLLLIRAPREWVYLDESAFQDVYDIMQFKLPASPVGWTETKAPKKMSVPMRLTAGNAADVPELWVLRDNAVEQLDILVRDSDDRLTQRLMFAVANDADGKRAVILRTRPSKLAPPVLPLENTLGFKPFWKLPNLFVPVGRRLHPTLRRDAVRRLLADDADQVVWLYPDADGRFIPESVPDGAFRPLEDWVDYVIEAEQKPLGEWIEATRFDFDHFICKDTSGPKAKPDKPEKDPRAEDEARGPKLNAPQPKVSGKGKATTGRSTTADYLPTQETVKQPSEWKLRREELEKQFLTAEGGLDTPERTALWPELAVASTGMGDKTEAAVCWLNAMWDADPIPGEWLNGWVRSELLATGGTIRADEFDKRLANAAPGQEDTRGVISSFLWLAGQNPLPTWLAARLPAVQAYLEQHEQALPVRAVWLAGYRLSQLSGADVLGLARVRDRVLQRLLEQGLTAEKDLPSFLRFAGHKDSERMRIVRDKAMELHAAVRKWTAHIPVNLPYVDLLFAFALAKLQESTQAKRLIEDARKEMEKPIPGSWQDQKHFEAVVSAVTQNFLFKAFKFRVDQVLSGKPHSGQMSADLVADFEEITNKGKTGGTNNPYLRADYVINRMRDQSRIIEPQERIDPYAFWTKNQDALKKELAELSTIKDPSRLADKIRKLHKEGVAGKTTKEVQFLVLHEAVPLSHRVGESFTVELLQLVPAALAGGPTTTPEPPDTPKKQGELIERALFMAGHFDRGDLVKKLVDEVSELLRNKTEDARFKLINVVAGQCLRSLKKLGMRDEIDRFLAKLRNEVVRGSTTAELKKKYAAKPEMWGSVLQTLLNLAAGWLTFGLHEQAAPILDEARNELLNPNAVKLPPKDYTQLAQTYVTALGQGPSETGLARITELFRKMDDKKITNTWTTAQFYSRFHLNLVEDVIRAIVSDDFALGPTGRKWLDDDEYLVRKRIHADMRRHLAQM